MTNILIMSFSRKLIFGGLPAIASLCVAQTHAVTPNFSATELTFQGDSVQVYQPPTINTRGDVVVVGSGTFQNQGTVVVRWEAHLDQPTVFSALGAANVIAYDLADNGSIVGLGVFAEEGSTLPNLVTYVAGYSISGVGETTLFRWRDSEAFQPQVVNSGGTIAGEDGGWLRILTPTSDTRLPFNNNVLATAINESDNITGFFVNDNHQDRTALFTLIGGTLSTYSSPLEGRAGLRGTDINATNTSSGWTYSTLAQRHQGIVLTTLAFTLTGETFTYLPALDPSFDAFAFGLNNLGWVVGQNQDPLGGQAAILWIDGIPHNLNDLTPNLPADRYLLAAYDLNDAGQIITLAVTPSGQWVPILLTPTPIPEPTSLLPLLLSPLLLRRR